MIYGLLETYWVQNSTTADYIHFARLLYQRLLKQGYKSAKVNEIFLEAATKIEKKSNSTPPPKPAHNIRPQDIRLFFHLEYHPRDISRQYVRDTYEKVCETPDSKGHCFKHMPTPSGEMLRVDRLTMCYSRPKNLRDTLVPSKLFETPQTNVRDILKKL